MSESHTSDVNAKFPPYYHHHHGKYVVPCILYSRIFNSVLLQKLRGKPLIKKAQTGRQDCRGERGQAAANERQTYQQDCRGEIRLQRMRDRLTDETVEERGQAH